MKSQLLLGYYCLDDLACINTKHHKITYFECTPDELPPKLIYELIEQDGLDLKRNTNSHVKLLPFANTKLVLKEPTRKNKRFLTRLFSLFRSSRAFQVAESLSVLRKAGIEANRPLCVLEKRIMGMVVYSMLIYEFIEGEPIEQKDLENLTATVAKINQLGYGHSDCHQGNFIKTARGIAPIDFVLRKHLFGRISIDLQFLKLFQTVSEDELLRLYPEAESKRFKLSRLLYELKTHSRSIKNRIKPYFYSLLLGLIIYRLIVELG